MNPQLIQQLLMGPDPRGNAGIFARGKNVYNGIGSAPNPVGNNQASAAKRLLQMRQQMYGRQM